MVRPRIVSANEDLTLMQAKVPLSARAHFEAKAAALGKKLGVWLRDHLMDIKAEDERVE